MSVTQKEIAQRLGVSQTLVTKALRGAAGVSEEARRRVDEVARELGYDAFSNSAARSLRARREGSRARTNIVGVLLAEFFDGIPLHEIPFYKPILRGLSMELERREMDLSLFSSPLHRVPRLLKDGGVDAIICLYTGQYINQDGPLQCPLLRVGDGAPHQWTLRPDDRRGTYLATSHLIDQGHRRIAYLGDFEGAQTPDVMYKNRLDGYLSALGDAGLKVSDQLIECHIGGPQANLGAAGMGRLLQRTRDFTAVVCFNDTSAMGAIAELGRQGLGVPDDVSVTGFDDACDGYGGPALTTVHFDRLEMGRRAVEAVCEAVDADSTPPPPLTGFHELLPVRLVERASTAPPRNP